MNILSKILLLILLATCLSACHEEEVLITINVDSEQRNHETHGDNFGEPVTDASDIDEDSTTGLAMGLPFDGDGTDSGAVFILFMNNRVEAEEIQSISITQSIYTGTLNSDDHFIAAMAGGCRQKPPLRGQSTSCMAMLRTSALIFATSPGYSRYSEMARHVSGPSWLTWPLQYPVAWSIIRGYDPIDYEANIAPVPLLLIHSQDDRIVPHAFNDELLQAALVPKNYFETRGPHTATFSNAQNREYLLGYLERTGQ